MKLVLNANNMNNWLKVMEREILCVLLSYVLTVNGDEEIPKIMNSSFIFKPTKTDKTLGEDCLIGTECSQSMHLFCVSKVCLCDDGYHKSDNNTCVTDSPKTGLEQYFQSPMLPILIVLAIMFVGICVALNLFSRARFRKSRSIFVNPKILKLAKAQERRASQLSQMSHNSGLRSPTRSYRSPRNSYTGVSPTHSYNGKLYGNHIMDPKRSPNSRSRSNSTSSLQMHLRA